MPKKRVNLLKAASLGIPAEVNVYMELKQLALSDPDTQVLVQALDETMEHFKVPFEKRMFVGNLIQRISMLLSRDDESEYYIESEDPALHNLIDMVEYFQRLAGEKLS